jgi:hypothetical protein
MSVCDRPCRRAAARLAAPPGTGRAGCRLLRAAVCPVIAAIAACGRREAPGDAARPRETAFAVCGACALPV